MSTEENRAKQYRDKADELRAMVDDMTDAQSRQYLTRLAEQYDAMAAKIEGRIRRILHAKTPKPQ